MGKELLLKAIRITIQIKSFGAKLTRFPFGIDNPGIGRPAEEEAIVPLAQRRNIRVSRRATGKKKQYKKK